MPGAAPLPGQGRRPAVRHRQLRLHEGGADEPGEELPQAHRRAQVHQAGQQAAQRAYRRGEHRPGRWQPVLRQLLPRRRRRRQAAELGQEAGLHRAQQQVDRVQGSRQADPGQRVRQRRPGCQGQGGLLLHRRAGRHGLRLRADHHVGQEGAGSEAARQRRLPAQRRPVLLHPWQAQVHGHAQEQAAQVSEARARGRHAGGGLHHRRG